MKIAITIISLNSNFNVSDENFKIYNMFAMNLIYSFSIFAQITLFSHRFNVDKIEKNFDKNDEIIKCQFDLRKKNFVLINLLLIAYYIETIMKKIQIKTLLTIKIYEYKNKLN